MWAPANKAHVKRHLSSAVCAGKESVLPLQLWLLSIHLHPHHDENKHLHHDSSSNPQPQDNGRVLKTSRAIKWNQSGASFHSEMLLSNTTEDKKNHFSLDMLSTLLFPIRKITKNSVQIKSVVTKLSELFWTDTFV